MKEQISAPPAGRFRGGASDPARASRLLGFTFGLFVVSVTIGTAWDRLWHVTRVFDTFFSPPHLFTYSMTIVSLLLVAYMALSPTICPWFGPAVQIPFLPVVLPGALVILGGGFMLLAFAGVLDAIWHSRFGLDETAWSTPHAMLGWGVFVVVLGFVACRLALRPHRPLSTVGAVVLGWLLLSVSAPALLGPFYQHKTPETVQAVASLPILAAQPPVQHSYAIYQTWNLTRTHPLFVPLAALWAGIGLSLVRCLDRRLRILLIVSFIWSLFLLSGERRAARGLDQTLGLQLSADPAVWLPIPIFPAALVLVCLAAVHIADRWAWPVAGAIFGIFVVGIWGPHLRPGALILLAAPAMAGGTFIGRRLFGVLEHPTQRGVRWLILAGVAMPFVTGIVDLYLRNVTPWP